MSHAWLISSVAFAAVCIVSVRIRQARRTATAIKKAEELLRLRRLENRELFQRFFMRLQRYFERHSIPVSFTSPNDSVYQPLHLSAVSAALTHSRFQIVIDAVEDELTVQFGQEPGNVYKEVEVNMATLIIINMFGRAEFCVRHTACSSIDYPVEEITDSAVTDALIQGIHAKLAFIDQLWRDCELKRKYITGLRNEAAQTESLLFDEIREQCEAFRSNALDRFVQPQT